MGVNTCILPFIKKKVEDFSLFFTVLSPAGLGFLQIGKIPVRVFHNRQSPGAVCGKSEFFDIFHSGKRGARKLLQSKPDGFDSSLKEGFGKTGTHCI